MPNFRVQVRAIRHLTAELDIEASSEEEARAKAESRFGRESNINWDESEPEDEQIESVQRGSRNNG